MNRPGQLAATLLLSIWLVPHGVTADTASHRAAIEHLFSLTQIRQKIDDSVQTVAALQLQQTPQLAAHREALTAFLERHIGWDALHEDLVQMYLQAFTEQELDSINRFYATPAGQKVITIVPQLVQQRNQLAMQRLQDNIGELQQIMNGEATPE